MLLMIIVFLLLIIVALLLMILRYRRRIAEMEYPYEMEERLLELLGKFKHVASIKLEMLERKIDELRKLVKEANDVYASLAVIITDATKFKNELEQAENEVKEVVEEGNTEKMVSGGKDETHEEEIEEETVEKKIMRLNEEGLSDTEIARELGIGVSEVKLVIDLFKRRGGK
ncbi:MAG: hypothetical protein J7L28_00330 [Thermotogae bacterium]|nr:hypothetical protein [Thermotogota bacterium]